MSDLSSRKEDRKKKTFRIKLKDGDHTYTGIVTNISKTGMSVKTNQVLPTFKAIEVLVKIDQKLLSLKGSIRWVREGLAPEEPGEEQYKNEIGIALLNPPAEYLRHFE
jgi:hypothetical protein